MFCDMWLFNRFTNWHGNYMIWNDSSYSSSYFRCVSLNECSSYSSYSSSCILGSFLRQHPFFRSAQSAHGKKNAQHHVWIVFVWNVAAKATSRDTSPSGDLHGTEVRARAWEGPCDSTRRWSEQKVSRRSGGRCRWHRWPVKSRFFSGENLWCRWFVSACFSIFNG
jgi:hypothetical protein